MPWITKTTEGKHVTFKVHHTEDEKYKYLCGLSTALHQIVNIPQKLFDEALKIFPDLDSVWCWLQEPNSNFKNLTPLQYMTSDAEVEKVIKHVKTLKFETKL